MKKERSGFAIIADFVEGGSAVGEGRRRLTRLDERLRRGTGKRKKSKPKGAQNGSAHRTIIDGTAGRAAVRSRAFTVGVYGKKSGEVNAAEKGMKARMGAESVPGRVNLEPGNGEFARVGAEFEVSYGERKLSESQMDEGAFG